MTNPTWDGIEIDYTDLQNYGWYRTNITVGGTEYPLLTGYQVAGLREMDTRLAAAGGSVPSIRYAWDTGTTDADPGTGEVRGNNATIASITTIYASTTDAGGASVSAIIDTWDDSTSTVKGRLRLAHRTDATKWAEFTISAVTSATGYRKLTVAYVAGSGALSAADPVALGFVRTGDKGDTGAVAAAGDGTAAAPGIGFANESGLGFFRAGVRQLGIAVGGVLAALFTGPANAVSYWIFGSAPSSTDEPYMLIGSSDTNVGAQISTKGTGPLKFMTASRSLVQAVVEHVAGATRWLIFRGSNGGDPTISTSGGALKIGVAARGTVVALTDGATITFDMALGNDAAVTLGGNRTFANPSNPAPGQAGSIFITQDGTGSRTLSFGSYWDFAGGTAPVLSTAAGAVDRLDYIVRTTTSIHAALAKAYS